jgi:hypothetical protein
VKRHSFKPQALHFQLTYEWDIIFAVPQICAYFVDNLHNLEIDSFKIAVSEHILLYFKNSNSFFFCVHMIMCGTRCVKLSWLVVYFRFRQVNIPHILSSDMCIHSHFKIKSSSHAMRNIIPSNNGLGVKRLSFSWLLDSTLFMLNLSTFLVASVYGK